MSRIGKRPVVVSKGVTAKLETGILKFKGPKGELSLDVSSGRYDSIYTTIQEGNVHVVRKNDSREARMQQGLVRALVQNMQTGVSEGFTKTLEIVGVGYKADLKGQSLTLNLGYSHPIEYPLPVGISATVDKQTRVTITGADKMRVGEAAACIRRFRPPEPYKGKGIRNADEVIRRKVGKAAAGSGG